MLCNMSRPFYKQYNLVVTLERMLSTRHVHRFESLIIQHLPYPCIFHCHNAMHPFQYCGVSKFFIDSNVHLKLCASHFNDHLLFTQNVCIYERKSTRMALKCVIWYAFGVVPIDCIGASSTESKYMPYVDTPSLCIRSRLITRCWRFTDGLIMNI